MIQRENDMEKILQNSEQTISQKQTSGQEEVPVRMSALQENEQDCMETEAVSFLNSLNCSKAKKKKIDPNGLSLRMLEDCCHLIRDGIFSNIYLKWMNAGMTCNGRFSTLPITEYPSTENGCTLSDILEDTADEKYYLSAEKTQQLILRL